MQTRKSARVLPDPEELPAIREVEWVGEYDRERELTFANDVVKDIVLQLMDEELSVRQKAYQNLMRMFGKDFGYQVKSSREERFRVLKQFFEWWNSVALFYSWDRQAQKIVFVEEAKTANISARKWSNMDLAERIGALQKALGRPLTESEFKRVDKKYYDEWGEFLELQQQLDALRQSLGRYLTNEEIDKVKEQYYKWKKSTSVESESK